MTKGDKINWLLILQGWAMLWVVIGHAPLGEAGEGPVWENILYDTAYSFHMPLFMLISGFLFYLTRIRPDDNGCSVWPYGRMVANKALRLLVPMVFFTVFAFALKCIFPSEMERAVNFSLTDLGIAFIYPYNGPLREMWFIYTIFLLFLLMPLWRTVLKRGWSVALTALVLLACHFWDPDVEFLSAGRVLDYGIWFFSGLVVARYDLIDRLPRRGWMVLMACGIIAAVIGHLSEIKFAVTIGYILFSIALALILDSCAPKLFRSFRNYTYQIFLMGIFAQMALKIAFRHYPLPYIPVYLACVAVGLYVPVLISLLLKRLNFNLPLALIGLKSDTAGHYRNKADAK